MADPLSIAAGLVAVAGAAVSICKLLFGAAKVIVEARNLISDLARSLTHFSSILQRLARVIKDAQDILDKDGIRDIRDCTRNCRLIVREIKRVFKEMDKKAPDFFDRVKWLFKQDSLRYPRARLEEAKADLTLNIEILSLALSVRYAYPNPDDPAYASNYALT